MLILVLFFIGLLLGSFLNAWIWRIREGLPIVSVRSMCPCCRKLIVWYDNIPLLSFYFLRGRCRNCQKKISWRYPIVELSMALLFVLVGFVHANFSQNIFLLAKDLGITFFLVAVFLYDLYYGEIPDRLSTFPAGALVLLSWLAPWYTVPSITLGIIVGGGFFLFQYAISKGRFVGGGDVRLGVLMGVVLGFPLVVVALFLAYISGAVISIILLLIKKKKLTDSTPFGTYLTAATFLTLLFGQQMLSYYLDFVSW